MDVNRKYKAENIHMVEQENVYVEIPALMIISGQEQVQHIKRSVKHVDK